MKNNAKKMVNYTIHVDENTANQINKLADYFQRKPAEFLRVILAPRLVELWAVMEREQHTENQEPPHLARFKK